ncbi:hypothetical protein QJS10_CPB17g01376 [Acorus calamus]|uniref:Uncharacterized protein n=1 Tax=Acorus calamus TaxID=4465 RepID=A0AAV9CXH9_ACOCL|nr:hypothetical protein QJS10_CPB17g01376 [Acorus calamus]
MAWECEELGRAKDLCEHTGFPGMVSFSGSNGKKNCTYITGHGSTLGSSIAWMMENILNMLLVMMLEKGILGFKVARLCGQSQALHWLICVGKDDQI